MSRNPDEFLARLWALDALAVEHGAAPLSPWWRETIDRAERSGKRRVVVRKGRRVGASTIVAPRLAVAEMLWGGHRHTPGAPPVTFAFLSVRRDEAAKRLAGVTWLLDLLGEPYRPVGETIEFTTRPAVFTVITASFRATVGDTVAFAWCDEVSRWNDGGSNPAEQVIGSLAPALATLPNASMWLVSSPLSSADYHARQFDLGDTGTQTTAFGETWVINPTITEADTYELEPHEPTRLREYAAVAGAGDTDFFGSSIANSTDVGRTGPEPIARDIRYFIAVDQAFQSDRFGYAVVTSLLERISDQDQNEPEPLRHRVTRVQEAGAWKPDRSPREMARRLRDEVCRRYRVERIFADQFGGLPFRELARDVGLRVEIVPWTGGDGDESKLARYRAVRVAMFEGSFRNPDDETLRREYRSARSVISRAGNERIEIPRSTLGHGDRLSAVVLAGSIALSKPAQLAPSQMTWWERSSREENQRRLLSAL